MTRARSSGWMFRYPTVLAGTAFVALASLAGDAHGAAVTYNITATPPSACTLADAMEAINRGVKFGSCAKPGLDSRNPDIIKLQAGKTFTLAGYPPATPNTLKTGTLFIKKAVTIQSATANTLATLSQNGAPQDGMLGSVIFINFPSAAATVTFKDIDVVGSRTTNPAIGIGIQGNDQSSVVTLTQSWVRNFGANGIYNQDASLTLQDSAVDNNGNNTGFNDGQAIFMESRGHTTSTRLFMDHSSITNNRDGALFTELGHGSVSTIRNSTISSNQGTVGGVLVGGPDNNYKVNFIGSTVAFNGGDISACGITCNTPEVAGIASPVTIDQTIVAGNLAAGSIPQDYCGILESTTNSEIDNIDVAVIKHVIGTTNLMDSFANLDVLADNGGKGQRHPKSNRPKTGSLVIDATSSANSALGGQDQGYHSRGVDRIPARTGLPNYNFDIGAVEF